MCGWKQEARQPLHHWRKNQCSKEAQRSDTWWADPEEWHLVSSESFKRNKKEKDKEEEKEEKQNERDRAERLKIVQNTSMPGKNQQKFWIFKMKKKNIMVVPVDATPPQILTI
jgi:hypothetical protein